MKFMAFLRKRSPVVVATGGVALMVGGVAALAGGVPPIPGLGPLEMIGAGWAAFLGAFAIPADADRDDGQIPMLAGPERNGEPDNGTPEQRQIAAETDIAHRWIEVVAYFAVAICGGGLAMVAYFQGDKGFAVIVVGIISYIGFNRFFHLGEAPFREQ